MTEQEPGLTIDTGAISRKERYHLLSQIVVPRPIAWVVSAGAENGDGTPLWNLAPYSYFNVVSSEPPMIVLGINSEQHLGGAKDTIRNIRDTAEFTIALPHTDLAEKVACTAQATPSDQSEAVNCGVALVEWPGWPVPRVRDVRLAMACRLFKAIELHGETQVLAVAAVEKVWVDPEIVIRKNGSLRIDVALFDPLARIGGGNFVTVGPAFRP